jgi:hypothetical protein
MLDPATIFVLFFFSFWENVDIAPGPQYACSDCPTINLFVVGNIHAPRRATCLIVVPIDT